MLALELVSLEDEHGHFVRAVYKGNKAGDPVAVESREIVGCSRPGDGLCPLDTFLELALQAVPTDIDQACMARTGSGAAPVRDCKVEACKDVVLGRQVKGDMWGAGRHTAPLWQKSNLKK